ncbi:MAG: VWA domain-containing protein [Legionella sp.]|nr:VWA domain-containing protein [Legionella sp.]
MGRLANNKLQTESIIKLLEKMNINLAGQTITCHDEWISVQSTSREQANSLISDLTTILLDDPSLGLTRKKVTISSLITKLITSATYCNQTIRDACLALLPILEKNWQYQYDPETKHLNIELGSCFLPIFEALQSEEINIIDSKFSIDISALLKTNEDKTLDVLLIEESNPLILIRHELFANKKIFYAQKTLKNGNIEVQPFFHLPPDVTPPDYHFILDTSSSMYCHMKEFKESVIRFAEALFEYQPNAKISLQFFNTIVGDTKIFTYGELEDLKKVVNSFYAYGSTALYKTVNKQLEQLAKLSLHNNYLLFTDGDNNDDDNNEEGQIDLLSKHMERLGQDPRLLSCNKFFIINYKVRKNEYLADVVNLFSSEYISSNEVDLQKALQDAEQLSVWASKRGLFTYSVQVVEGQFSEYSLKADYANQFVPLEKLEFAAHEKLDIELTIKDVEGRIILSDKRCLNNPSPVVKHASNSNILFPNSEARQLKQIYSDPDLEYNRTIQNQKF